VVVEGGQTGPCLIESAIRFLDHCSWFVPSSKLKECSLVPFCVVRRFHIASVGKGKKIRSNSASLVREGERSQERGIEEQSPDDCLHPYVFSAHEGRGSPPRASNWWHSMNTANRVSDMPHGSGQDRRTVRKEHNSSLLRSCRQTLVKAAYLCSASSPHCNEHQEWSPIVQSEERESTLLMR
jgi:hypothetical protein